MTANTLVRRIIGLYEMCAEIASLPVAKLHFRSAADPERIRSVYDYFTKPHPKYKVFGNKTVGAALIHLRDFGTAEDFIESLRLCGRGANERRRAQARGYRVSEIARNQYAEAIHEINVSVPVRQGEPMHPAYVEKKLHYDDLAHFRYYGVLDQDGALVAYCNVGMVGNFAIADRVLGLRSNDGAMFLLVTEIACLLIAEGQLDYFMYDTVFGAKQGMRDFKRRLGFQPYRVKYSID